MMPVAALTAALVGVPQAWGRLTLMTVLVALIIAILMPVMVFAFEMLALRRLTTAAFGTLMGLEPAIAIVVGVVLLSQVPDVDQMLGIALVVIAGIGAERIGRGDGPLIEPPSG